MIEIQSITYSKNPVNTGEAFLLYVTCIEILAFWSDLQVKTWGDVPLKTWNDLFYKNF